MQQELLLKRDELARAHQLGELQQEYPFRLDKRPFALIGVVFVVLLIFAVIYGLISLGFSWGVLLIVLIFIATSLLIGLIVGGVSYYYRNLYVGVYAGGLIYLFRNKERAVRWEQIREVSLLYMYFPHPQIRGFRIDVQDEPPLDITYFSKELVATIQREVESPRRSGQEPEQKEGFSTRCRFCNAELMAGAAVCGACGRPVAVGSAEVSTDNSNGQAAPLTPAAPSNGSSVMRSDPGPWVPVSPGPQPGTPGGSHMQQDPSLQRDELVRTHQLGELQQDYTIAFGKQIKNLLVRAIVPTIWMGGLILYLPAWTTIGGIPLLVAIIYALFYTAAMGSALGRLIYYSSRRLHVYLYTGGLLYMERNTMKAVRWEQINNVSRGRGGAVRIDWGGPTEPRLRLTPLITGLGGLYTTIQREQGTMPTSQVTVQPLYAAAPQPPTRWRLWIILGAIGTLVLVGCIVLIGVLISMNSATPTGRLNTYCNALKRDDYQTAYNQLSSGLQSKFGSEAQFAAGFSGNASTVTAILGKLTNCLVSNVNEAAGSATISYTFESGGTLVENFSLESGSWQINGWQPRSSPTLTLDHFCYALLQQNYPTAYAQFSSYQQSLQSEAQFANRFTGDPVSTCTVNTVDETAGTGSITRTYADGSSNTVDFTLIVENGTWKINTRQVRP